MSLTNYKAQFDNSYQEIFQKVLVGKMIANTRFESVLKYGASVTRVAYDISGVKVRSVNRSGASTIDTISDSPESLIINLEKETVFYISDGEATQAGPLNPGEVIGGQVAIKIASDLDYNIFKEVINAAQTFDTGDLTTLVSSGTPITLSATTVPQMVTRMPAKLRRGTNQTITNMALVVDSYAAADIEQYLLGKQFSIVESVFKNGYAGPIATANVYVSENLSSTSTLTISVLPTAGETVTINGVVFTFVATPAVAGDVALGANAAAANANLAALINAPTVTTANGIALSSQNANSLNQITKGSAVATATTTVFSGAGRLVLAETLANVANTWGVNIVHCYYGKVGAIDLVVQNLKEVDMRIPADRRGTNIFSHYLAGIKTFSDGAKKFLDVQIAA